MEKTEKQEKHVIVKFCSSLFESTARSREDRNGARMKQSGAGAARMELSEQLSVLFISFDNNYD